jgi:hypothetical protein
VREGRRLTLALVVGVLAGCGASAGSTAPTAAAPSIQPTATIAPAPSVGTPGPSDTPTLAVLHDGAYRPIAPGTYITGQAGFLPGLGITIPAGWVASETDSGEISLAPADRPNDKLLLWKDLAAVVTNNRDGNVGSVLPNVGRTADALIAWVTSTTDFKILSAPATRTIGDSITGTEMTVGVSTTADFGDSDCPDNPRCAAFFKDPIHWGDEFYAIGGDEIARIFIATAHFPEGDHTLFVTLDVVNSAELAEFAPIAEPIIQSLRLPATYMDN